MCSNSFTAKLFLHAKKVQQGGSSALQMKGSESLEQLFPGAIAEDKFIENMSRVGMDLGFNPKTVINFVSTCKDDISRTFTTKLDRHEVPKMYVFCKIKLEIAADLTLIPSLTACGANRLTSSRSAPRHWRESSATSSG
jgi:hypothetical protein